jgi:2',3'-cyclic-nucleotide 2'-phosphodiesterase (5'-nucleotidase family)
VRRARSLVLLAVVPLIASLAAAPAAAAPPVPVTFTILHTNDFHGQLELSGSNPGAARMAKVINDIRAANTLAGQATLLVDGGDEMQGSLLSNLQQGAPTIGTFNALAYDAATFGNHEFDWGQAVLGARTTQATYPYVTANIVVNDTGNCATAGWGLPTFADAPYTIKTVGTAPNQVKVGFIGVTTAETPTITVASATAGLCFKDAADSIVHYYDQMKADGADVIVVLSHLGFTDGGYGYGIPVYGDQTLAARLNTAGKPANLIIGGHSHTNMAPPATVVGSTVIAHAYYNGRTVGRADVTVSNTGAVSIAWTRTTGYTGGAVDPAIDALVTAYASDPTYQALINQPIGYSAVDLLRNYNGDNMMGDFIDDAIYSYLNQDGVPANDVDMFFNNAGGLRADWCWNGSDWVGTGCVSGVHAPGLLTYGDMFTILPFGNATIVGTMTGAQILELLHQSATLFKGAIQPSGIRYSFYRYSDALPGPQPYAWGAFDVTVYDKGTGTWVPLDLKKTYSVGTNEFLAPAGQDGFTPFKYMTNVSYWGDMLNAVNAYVTAHHGTSGTAYMGPTGTGALDGRITRDGTDATGSIVPVTILHHNDSHGNLYKGAYVGYTQLATLIKQEKLHNPTRTILLSGGDNIQGDAMSYYFKSAPLGYAADGTPLPADLQMQPLIKLFNTMGYAAMTLGNHEFNFGSQIFKAVMGQATFPILGANVSDTGAYGLATAQGGQGVKPYVEEVVGAEGIKVAILGITNHRVPNYELPSNIVGLTFTDPIAKAQELAAVEAPVTDAVVALTHIGFTENPSSVEVDANVDTNLAAVTNGIDAIVGSHSHTNPATGFGAYKYLPTIVSAPNGAPVVISQAYRYNNTLGELVLGMRASGGGYDVVSSTGRYISVATSTAEDPATKALIDPYVTALNAYNNKVLGQTTVPIDALQAFTQETNGANLQADASVYELNSHGITPDVHLSGAMTNKAVATSGPYPVTLKVSDMFTLMPYENSLVVMNMNGPQIKKVLERAYRNYYYYKYVPGYGGYSYYTTCMIDTNSVGQITYNDIYPLPYDPNRNYVASLTINGVPVDFKDATKYYKVSTVNYLAAGSCNFNDGGVSLWPLNQIANDTQFYVRDAVIDYITAMGTVSPAIEGRLQFISVPAPTIVNVAPTQGPAGTLVTITGTDFLYVQSVTVGGVPVAYTVVNPTTITFLMPAGGLSGKVVVTTLGGTATSTVTFTVALTPVITSFSPGAGKVGSLVTVFGTNLGYARQVTIGGTPAQFRVVSPSTLTATVPPRAASGKITVTTPYGVATSAKAFYILP